jgi:radical SAM protein with 4Fe4S-binding SPASM domain
VNVDAAALASLDALADLLDAEGFTRSPKFTSYVKAIFPTKHGSTQSGQVVLSQEIRRRLVAGVNVPVSGARPSAGLVTDADVADKLASSDRLSRLFSGYPVIHNKIDALFRQRTSDALRPSHCGTASLQVLIFDPRGDVYPCNNLVGRPEHRVGTYHPRLQWQDARVETWRKRVVSSMPDVVACKYALFCGGGCAFDAAVAHSDVRAKACDCADFARAFAGMVASSYRRLAGDALAEA